MTSTHQPTTSRRTGASSRGLRNKKHPSQRGLIPDISQRGRIGAGSPYHNMGMLADPQQPAASSTTGTREPQFLAAPSVHVGLGKSESSRRDLMTMMRSSHRGGLRQNFVRLVSESSMVDASGSSMEECILDLPHGRNSMISALGESCRSFFSDTDEVETAQQPELDELSIIHSRGGGGTTTTTRRMTTPPPLFVGGGTRTTTTTRAPTPTSPVPPPSAPAPAPPGPSSSSNNEEVRRTFEDISMEAQTMDANENDDNYEIEISPGVYLPFRGAKETWQAVHDGYILETTCLECCAPLISVPDCQCVVCSDCRMVNPVFEHPRGVHPQTIHGAGLGLQKEWVLKRQQERDFSRRGGNYNHVVMY